MDKLLIVDLDKCTGCRICELACSFEHEGVFNPRLSRISVVSFKRDGIDIPITCQQCETALCLESCPSRALYRDSQLRVVLLNEKKCIGCYTCIMVCPFGGASVHSLKKVAMKCDLCGGTPKCVEFCPVEAIEYAAADKVGLRKKRLGAEKMLKYISLIQKEG